MNILIGSHKTLICEFQREASGISCLDRGNHTSFMVTVSLFLFPCESFGWCQHQICARKFDYSEAKDSVAMILCCLEELVAWFRGEGDWQRNIHSGVSFEIRNSFIVDCCVAHTVFFADEYFRDDTLSGGDRNTCMRNDWA